MPAKRRRSLAAGGRRNVRRRLFSGGSRRFVRARTRFSRKNKRTVRRYRRFKRRRVTRTRSFKRRSSSLKAFRNKAMRALIPAQDFYAQYGQQHTVPTWASGSVKSIYFTTERYNAAQNKETIVNCPLFMNNNIANCLNVLWKGTLQAMQLAPAALSTTYDTSRKSPILIGGKSIYTLRNQSTEDEYLTAYWCKARRDVTLRTPTPASTTVYNLYQFLARGFAQSGIDPFENLATTNDGMEDVMLTPFQSIEFTRNFKIVKTKKIKLDAGGSRRFFYGAKTRLIRPDDYFLFDDADDSSLTWSTCPERCNFNRHTRFILFQLHSRPAGYGAAQLQYSKLISSTTPTIILDTKHFYRCRIHHQFRTPIGLIEQNGYAVPSATTNVIINPDTAALADEKDAE